MNQVLHLVIGPFRLKSMIYEILREPTDFEIERLIEICHENFTYKISKNELIYLINSKLNSKLYVARKGGYIIALYLILDNEIYVGGRLASYLAVSKSSRSIEIFINFTRFVYDDLMREGVGFIYGVANINALTLHKRLGGWKVAFDLYRVKLAVVDCKTLGSNGCATQADKLEFEFDGYSNWRFLNFSERNYVYFTACGVRVVAKIWKEMGCTRLHLMQIDWKEANAQLQKIIDKIYMIATEKGCDEIDFWAPSSICNELKNIGHEFECAKIEVICKSLNGNKMLEADKANSFGFGATDSF